MHSDSSFGTVVRAYESVDAACSAMSVRVGRVDRVTKRFVHSATFTADQRSGQCVVTYFTRPYHPVYVECDL